jgi:hypothetical protein
LRRLEQQPWADHGKEGLEHSIELLVLFLVHLRPVLDFALLAEQAGRKLHETRVERAQTAEALVADEIDILKRLRRGDFGFEEERFAVCRLLRLEVELVGARCSNRRELLLECRSHGANSKCDLARGEIGSDVCGSHRAWPCGVAWAEAQSVVRRDVETSWSAPKLFEVRFRQSR